MKKIFSLFITIMLLQINSCDSGINQISYDNPYQQNNSTLATSSVITISAILGVVVPVIGATPVTAITETAQYTGTVEWSPSAGTIFAGSTAYTAIITLTAKTGFTLTGVSANFFTVAGVTSNTNPADFGVVTAVFPATGVAPATFISVTQTGGASSTATTTALTLTFSVDPTSLAASNITVTGATKGALSGTGTTRSLAISDITVANGATVSVTVTSPAGFTITGSPQTAVVYRRLLTIGMDYLGGKIAYILVSGDPGYDAAVPHGLIAATADQSTGATWGCSGTSITGADGTAIGTGNENTIDIEAGCTTSGTAADICANLSSGGYSDWYLPSIDELNKLYLNSADVGGFAYNYYWSSSEVSAILAWNQYFGSGYQSNDYKVDVYRVRAVRAF